MKIVYTIKDHTTVGGTERVLSLKMNYLVDHGYNIAIISNEAIRDEPFFALDPRIEIVVLDIPDKKENKELYLSRLSDQLHRIKPDIVISTGVGLGRELYMCNYDCVKILEWHFSKYGRKTNLVAISKYWWGRLIADYYFSKRIARTQKYDKCILLTEEDRQQWGDLPNLTVIGNPISFTPERQSNTSEKKVITIGRFTSQKGFDLLLDIWRDIQILHPEWKLLIYGSGTKQKKLEGLIAKYKLSDTVELRKPSPQIMDELIDSSIYAMTSRYEGFGMVLVEAMVSGLPVISYACKCGPRDIISNGEDGFLIEVGDRKEYIKKLSLLMSNEDLRKRMGQKAVENVQRYNIESIMPKWESLFEEIINDRE